MKITSTTGNNLLKVVCHLKTAQEMLHFEELTYTHTEYDTEFQDLMHRLLDEFNTHITVERIPGPDGMIYGELTLVILGEEWRTTLNESYDILVKYLNTTENSAG
jgi:hypothetical protein